MKDTTGRNQPKRRGRPATDSPELRVVGIDFNPAPDAEERLRRLFMLLASHFAGEEAKPPEQKSPLEDGSAEVE